MREVDRGRASLALVVSLLAACGGGGSSSGGAGGAGAVSSGGTSTGGTGTGGSSASGGVASAGGTGGSNVGGAGTGGVSGSGTGGTGGGVTCTAGFANCDAAAPDCETNIGYDAQNCGACKNVCPTPANGKPTCIDGKCSPYCNPGYVECKGVCVTGGCDVVSANAIELELNQTHVYFIDGVAGKVRRVPLDGGAIDDFVPGTYSTLTDIGLTATHVYWCGDGKVYRAELSGANVQTLASPGSTGYLGAGKDVYFGSGATLYRLDPSAGGSPQAVLTKSGMTMGELSLHAGAYYVAYSSTTAGGVSKLPTDGGPVSELATGQVGAVAVTAQLPAFWVGRPDGVYRWSGAGTPQLIKSVANPTSVMNDAQKELYVAAGDSVLRVNATDGSAQFVVASGQAGARSLRITGQSTYKPAEIFWAKTSGIAKGSL